MKVEQVIFVLKLEWGMVSQSQSSKMIWQEFQVSAEGTSLKLAFLRRQDGEIEVKLESGDFRRKYYSDLTESSETLGIGKATFCLPCPQQVWGFKGGKAPLQVPFSQNG